ncbi:MAG: alpha/beta fold hydrolase [Candidatus Latescibacteria bacterium]|nr:alpha/beta fold hydrolase [Candidatus Latescibacterota bacterium]
MFKNGVWMLIVLASWRLCTPLQAEEALGREPLDEDAFAQVADYFAYDPSLPLAAQVIDTQSYSSQDSYVVDKVRFGSTYNQVVPGLFVHPPDSTVGCAAVLLLHGNNGSQGIDQAWVRSWLDIMGRAGYCALAIDAYGYGERMGAGPNWEMGLYAWRERTIQQVVDTRRAVDYLHSRAQVDSSRIALMGESMGALIGLRAAGLESRLAGVVALVAAAGEFPPTGPFGKFANGLNYVPRIQAPVLMVNATRDEYAAKSAVEELYAAVQPPKKLVWHDGGHAIPIEFQQRIVLPWLAEQLKKP